MSERTKKIRRNLAATAAALGIAAGVAGEVQAKSAPVTGSTEVGAISGPERFIPTEEITAQTIKELKSGKLISFYRGSVTISERDGSKAKYGINNPFIIPRVKNPEHPNRIASKEFALGYFKPDAQLPNGKNLGGMFQLVVLPIRKYMSFSPNPNREVGAPILDQVKFNTKPWGIDINHPTRADGSLVSDPRIAGTDMARQDPQWAVELVGIGFIPPHNP